MEKIGLQPSLHVLKPASYVEKTGSVGDIHKSFAKSLTEAIEGVNKTQKASDAATTKLINGDITNVHDVMIAAQKASVTRTLTVEVRNKVIDAYKEIMRMPM